MPWKISSSTVKMSSSRHLMSGYEIPPAVAIVAGVLLQGYIYIKALLKGQIKQSDCPVHED